MEVNTGKDKNIISRDKSNRIQTTAKIYIQHNLGEQFFILRKKKYQPSFVQERRNVKNLYSKTGTKYGNNNYCKHLYSPVKGGKSITYNSCLGNGTKAPEFLNAFHGLKSIIIVYVKSRKKIKFIEFGCCTSIRMLVFFPSYRRLSSINVEAHS